MIAIRAGAPVVAALLLAACFHYVPAEVSPPPAPRTEVRLTLSDPLTIPMGSMTLTDVNRIEGIVTEADSDTLDLLAQWLHPRYGHRHDAMLGSYSFPVSRIEQLETWRLSAKRTVVFAGVGAAVIGIFFELARRALAGDLPGGPPRDTQ